MEKAAESLEACGRRFPSSQVDSTKSEGARARGAGAWGPSAASGLAYGNSPKCRLPALADPGLEIRPTRIDTDARVTFILEKIGRRLNAHR